MKKLLFLLALSFSLSAAAQNLTIPDANFKYTLVNALCSDTNMNGLGDADVDTNNDGEIQLSEAQAVTRLMMSGRQIGSLSGIENFTNLEWLYCNGNNLTSLNLQGLVHLQRLDCYSNQLTSIDLSGLTSLNMAYIAYNQLTSVTLQNLPNLSFLDCTDNQLSALNVQGLTNLDNLVCNYNNLSTIDLQGLTNLSSLMLFNNAISALDVQGNPELITLYVENNQLSSLDLHGLSQLRYLDCSKNQLSTLSVEGLDSMWYFACDSNQITTLNIKNRGTFHQHLSFESNPNLTYICCSDDVIPVVQNRANQYGLANCAINSYCSFTPTSNYYTVTGRNTTDFDANGCDANDGIYPQLHYNITSVSDTGTLIANTSGNYALNLLAGTHTITPVLHYASYYNISPSTVQAVFPSTNDTLFQDFCITPNGTHHDLEISILPMLPARPGFNASYRLVYKNNGTATENGTLTFAYDESRLNYLSASQSPNNQNSGSLTWIYNALAPFESRAIVLNFYCNSPTNVPALNSGDTLSYTANIQEVFTDETPTDNSFTLNQVVVGSYDPNDKTCLEGKSITPEQLGEYLHYVIRFENTGTYAAENIVVKDMIDLSKFDINTLTIVDASHAMRTNITRGNQVEFIFEGINLPFDNASNDGFVAFKIKTLPNIALGEVIRNQASIYFDYNLPIITNEAQTTVEYPAAIYNIGNEKGTEIALFPNPTQSTLNIPVNIKVERLDIYDINGRLIQSQQISANQVDVKSLESGVYFVRLYGMDAVYYSKFVKQ